MTAKILIPFDEDLGLDQYSDHVRIPDYSKSALQNYLFYGFQPGGFLTAVICNDLYRAAIKADPFSKKAFFITTKWIFEFAPENAWGSIEKFNSWSAKENQERDEYRDAIEKKEMWRILTVKD